MSDYVTHLPCENIDTHLKRLSKTDLKIVAFCMIEQQSLATIANYLHTQRIESLCKRLAKLANAGYLANVKYHVNGDTFTTINHDATRYRTYPAVRSDRIKLATKRKRLNGGWN